MLKRRGRAISYRYDFGDNWTHTLTLEQIIVEGEFASVVGKKEELGLFRTPLICLDGQRACSPEDIGGIFGYQEFCEAISNHNHDRHKEFTDWYEDLNFL